MAPVVPAPFGCSAAHHTLKFQPDTLGGVNTIARHDASRIVVGDRPHVHSIVVPWVGEVQPWRPRHIADLQAADIEPLVRLAPELVILGTGSRLRFPAAQLLRALIEHRIGFESMDTAAACRTYNVLVTERRSVVAALILEDPAA